MITEIGEVCPRSGELSGGTRADYVHSGERVLLPPQLGISTVSNFQSRRGQRVFPGEDYKVYYKETHRKETVDRTIKTSLHKR